MKIEDTLNYNLEKYNCTGRLKPADIEMEIPDELSFMNQFKDNEEVLKWLSSLLLNCRNRDRVISILQLRCHDLSERQLKNRIVEILKDTWLIECV